MKTGGGSRREGLGRGIHWHIENPTLFYATDDHQQEIPYIRVLDEEGGAREFIDIETAFDPTAITEADLIEMDCITCHNRITHFILPPEDTVDGLLARGAVSPTIPEIRRKAIEVYGQEYASISLAMSGIAGLEGYYTTYYAEFYDQNSGLITDAIHALQEAYRASVFPEQAADWNSHPNNAGHKDAPGCFRCHDGKHLDAENQAIRLECNLCHSIPVVAGPSEFVARIEISRGPEPESHLNANWITLHRDVFNPSCQNCHTTENPGGADDSSFCSNSACHGAAWTYAGFDAPGLRELLEEQASSYSDEQELAVSALPLAYEGSIGAVLNTHCSECHGETGIQGLDVTSYETLLSGGLSGPAILVGDPDGSLIVQKLTGDQPHFAQLTPEEIDLLVTWIAEGAAKE
jgi:mono/diheme cytochrome c family protein